MGKVDLPCVLVTFHNLDINVFLVFTTLFDRGRGRDRDMDRHLDWNLNLFVDRDLDWNLDRRWHVLWHLHRCFHLILVPLLVFNCQFR